MSMTIKQAFNGSVPNDEMDLVEVSDELWKIGSLEDIRRATSPALFTVHIAMNVIGCWKGDGWHEIISSQPQLLPHIPETMEALGLGQIAGSLREVLSGFPDFISFSGRESDSALHCDAVNFLQNPRLKVYDERLNGYSMEERAAMCKRYAAKVDVLEEQSEALWLSGALDDEGWEPVLEYIRRHFEE